MTSLTARDRHGKRVRIGTRVRLLEIAPWVLDRANEEENPDLLSMVGEIFDVHRIEDGRAYIEKWWNETKTSFMVHGYWLEAHEMEVAKRSDGPTKPQNAARPEPPPTRRARREWDEYMSKMVRGKGPRHVCKHCGAKVRGVLTGGGAAPLGPGGKLPGFHWFLSYEFICKGLGHHGKNNSDRHWEWTESSPSLRAAQKGWFSTRAARRPARRRPR